MTVLGSKEQLSENKSRWNTWCDFCSRQIKKDEPVLEGKGIPTEEGEWMGERTFIIHQDCNQARNRIHKLDWQKTRTTKKSKGKKQQKKVFNTDKLDKKIFCNYCNKWINGEYVKSGGQRRSTYHPNCLKRKTVAENRTRASIRGAVGFR